MSTNVIRACVPIVAALLAWAAPAAVQAQATGSVTGTVLDRVSGQPVMGARMVLVGTRRQAVTNQDGSFRFDDVPAGEATLRVLRIGYAPQDQTVAVTAGQPTTADFRLEPSAILLDQVFVTATGELRNREVANAVAKIDVLKEVDAGAITNFSDLLSSRAPGVIVSPSSGSTGSGTRVRVRGANRDRKSTRLNSSHSQQSRMPSSA